MGVVMGGVFAHLIGPDLQGGGAPTEVSSCCHGTLGWPSTLTEHSTDHHFVEQWQPSH